MEEETIFHGDNSQTSVPPVQQNQPIMPTPQISQPNLIQAQPQIQEQSVQSSPPPPPIPEDHSDGFPLKKVLIFIAIFLFALAIILGVISFIFSGKNKPDNQQKRVLSYWGVYEDPEYMKNVIADFEKANPDISVKYEKQDLSTYREKLSTRIPNGNGPDIYSFHNTWLPQMDKFLSPLPNDVITKEEFSKDFYPTVQKDLINNNAIYGIPLEIDTLAMFVNPQILDAAGAEAQVTYEIPVTWQDFIKTTSKITKRDDQGKIVVAGAGIGTYDNVEHAPDIISLLFAQNGVDFDKLNDSEKKIDDALTFYTNFALIENNVYDNTLDNTVKAFADGKLAIFFGYSTDYFKIKRLSPNLNFKIVPVPQLLNSDKVNVASYWAEGVSSKSDNKADSLLFMKYLTKPEVQEKLFQEQTVKAGFGHPYSNKSLASKLKGTPFQVFTDQATTAVSSPFVDNTFDNGLNDKLNTVLQGIVNGILNGQSDGIPAEILSVGKEQVINEINGIAPKNEAN